jgi:glutamate/tyrosine decarboxylase-like PLP-dependent enzyme
MERADSLAFDLHKWLYVPFEAGCILVRSADVHRRAFTLTPDYLKHGDRGLGAGSIWFSDYTPQLTRGFRALKVWMSIKEHGIAKYGRLIQQNFDQAHYLADKVDAMPELERLAPVPLNIVCFRYKAVDLDNTALDHLNEEILLQLHERGIAIPSSTLIHGHYAIRVCITNHRTRTEDLDLLLREIVGLGQQWVTQFAPQH